MTSDRQTDIQTYILPLVVLSAALQQKRGKSERSATDFVLLGSNPQGLIQFFQRRIPEVGFRSGPTTLLYGGWALHIV